MFLSCPELPLLLTTLKELGPLTAEELVEGLEEPMKIRRVLALMHLLAEDGYLERRSRKKTDPDDDRFEFGVGEMGWAWLEEMVQEESRWSIDLLGGRTVGAFLLPFAFGDWVRVLRAGELVQEGFLDAMSFEASGECLYGVSWAGQRCWFQEGDIQVLRRGHRRTDLERARTEVGNPAIEGPGEAEARYVALRVSGDLGRSSLEQRWIVCGDAGRRHCLLRAVDICRRAGTVVGLLEVYRVEALEAADGIEGLSDPEVWCLGESRGTRSGLE